mgnify:FL=1
MRSLRDNSLKNKCIHKLVIGLLLSFISQISLAHNPLIATYLLTHENQQWKLKIFTTLNTLHQSLLKQFDKDELIDNKGNYNQSVAMNYFKQHIQLTSNKSELKLTPQTANISNHQSQFIFTIENGEHISGAVHAKIVAMTDHLGQHNLFKVKAYNKKVHVMLSVRNDYQGKATTPIDPTI